MSPSETQPAEPLRRGALLLFPRRVRASLRRVSEAEVVPRTPNLWQVTQGVMRMWYRVYFRPESIGTCREQPVRATLRARVLEKRPLRFPFLLAERAIAPLDFSGLASTKERVIRHLLGAHHDANQFVYDLEMLALYEGALEELAARTRAVVEGSDPRARWLRDLVVYEGYHESLLAAVERALEGDFALDDAERSDPDVSFAAYLRWCAAQPQTPRETLAAWRRGERPDYGPGPNPLAAPCAQGASA